MFGLDPLAVRTCVVVVVDVAVARPVLGVGRVVRIDLHGDAPCSVRARLRAQDDQPERLIRIVTTRSDGKVRAGCEDASCASGSLVAARRDAPHGPGAGTPGPSRRSRGQARRAGAEGRGRWPLAAPPHVGGSAAIAMPADRSLRVRFGPDRGQHPRPPSDCGTSAGFGFGIDTTSGTARKPVT